MINFDKMKGAFKMVEMKNARIEGENVNLNNCYEDCSTVDGKSTTVFKQERENFPTVFKEIKKYFPVNYTNDGRKIPTVKGWNRAENQKHLHEISNNSLVGLDCTEKICFLDFDHVLNESGEFVNKAVAECVNKLVETFPDIYIEFSASRTGLHAFLIPTTEKIPTLSQSQLYFDDNLDKESPKLEIFYNTKGRWCLLTGNKYNNGEEIPTAENSKVDDYLKSLVNAIEQQNKTVGKKSVQPTTTNNDYNDPPQYTRDLAVAIVKEIGFADFGREDWLPLISALKNLGLSCDEVEELCKNSSRYNEKNFAKEFESLHDSNFTIETIIGTGFKCGLADDFIKNFKRDWYNNRPEISSNFVQNKSRDLLELENQLQEINKQLADLEFQGKQAVEFLRNVESFDTDKILNEEFLKAVALCKLSSPAEFITLKTEIKKYRDKNKQGVTLPDFLTAIRPQEEHYQNLKNNLLDRQRKLTTAIKNLKFSKENNAIEKFVIPNGYAVTDEGIIKIVAGKNPTTINVSPQPIYITKLIEQYEKSIFRLELCYKSKDLNKWVNIPAQIAEGIFDAKQLVKLCNYGLSVNSKNAGFISEYLTFFKVANESEIEKYYSTQKCGWYEFGGEKKFISPYRENFIVEDDRKVKIIVDNSNSFASNLKSKGDLNEWKKAYELAKKSPVARFIVASTISAPLLEILGERNFLLYISAPTTGGKTTALMLAGTVYGNKKVIHSLDATRNAITEGASEVNDFAFLLDEKQLAGKNLIEQAQLLIYSLANGLGRSRLDKNANIRPVQDWRTIAVLTGETSLIEDNFTGGTHTRTLQLCTQDAILDAESCRAIREIIKENYGLLMPIVIDKIFEFGLDNLKDCYKNVVDSLTSKKEFAEKLPEHIRFTALLTIGDALINSALGYDENDSFESSCDVATEILMLIPTVDEISDTAREIEIIQGFIVENQRCFFTSYSKIDKMPAVYGEICDDYTYITVKAVKDACRDNGLNYSKVVKDLTKDGFFEPAENIEKDRKSPRATVLNSINGKTTRCYRIPREKI